MRVGDDVSVFTVDPAAPNIVPSKYRQVALASVPVALDAASLRSHFLGREAFMRTSFIVARADDGSGRSALVEVQRTPNRELFSPIADVRLLAGPDECVYVRSPHSDVGVPSHMATVAAAEPAARCVIVEGRYGHVSFLLNPRLLRVNVLDIVPPGPSKLLDQAQRVIDVAEDLPPIVLSGEPIDTRVLLAADARDATDRLLLPCKVSSGDFAPRDVRFLDQRPAREEWTLLGCQRSRQIHSWFYGDEPDTVDTCPRRLLSPERDAASVTLTRCCLLQEGFERRGRTAIVPWGSSLNEVRAAIVDLAATEQVTWTPT